MEFSAYSEYKHSGVEWLGEVPSHWPNTRFKHVFFEKKHTQNMDLPFGAISFGKVVFKEDRANLTEELKANYQEVRQGEFLINPLNLNYDLKSLRTALSKIDVVVSSGYIVLDAKDDKNSKAYLEYLLYIFDIFHMKSMGAGIRQTINFNDIGKSEVSLPPINEQNQIAQFLDKETAKIDELIAKQEQLIVLLEEQRKSVISYAVTKGLNPNAPMKDSGVEWLGEVPEHWDIRKVFSLCEQIGSGTTPSATNNDYYENGTINFLQTGDLTDGYVNLTKKKITEKALNEFSALKIYPKDSLVIAMYGATIGKIGILNIETTVNQACCVLNLSSQIDLNFAYYLFLSAKSFLISLSQGGTQPNINQDSIKSLRVTLPSKSEQRQIVEFLKKETLLIDNLIQKQQELITQLKEYRTSVISHAVTGKIDVRGLV